MDFAQIQTKLRQNFAGAGGTALDTYAGSMAKLSVATSNASETIGTALLDAIIKVTGSNGVDGLVSKIDTLASAFASVVTEVGNAVSALTGTAAQKAFSPAYYVSGGKAGGKTVAATGAGNMALSVLSQDTQKSDLAARKKAENEAIKRNKELAKLARQQAAAALATTKAKKEQAALDKAMAAAQLALGKGVDVFDMDKIQLNAALIGQAEALGKAESAAQVLSIANDIQRLKVKQSINELEDAIASKDVARIERATKQLNEDLKILGTLQSQNFTLLGIKGILDNLKPKELIDQENLNMALAKIKEMIDLLSKVSGTTAKTTTPSALSPFEKFVSNQPLSKSTADLFAELKSDTDWWQRNGDTFEGFTPFVGMKIDSNGGTSTSMPSTVGLGTTGTGRQIPIEANYTVNVNAGVIGSEDVIVDAVQNALNEISRRGYTTTYAGAIAG
jgi:hypothetical protein